MHKNWASFSCWCNTNKLYLNKHMPMLLNVLKAKFLDVKHWNEMCIINMLLSSMIYSSPQSGLSTSHLAYSFFLFRLGSIKLNLIAFNFIRLSSTFLTPTNQQWTASLIVFGVVIECWFYKDGEWYMAKNKWWLCLTTIFGWHQQWILFYLEY